MVISILDFKNPELVIKMTFQSVFFSTLDIEHIHKLFPIPSFQACISSSWK